ncbi:beta-lactamase family protein [Flavihumibacter rivuli]|uniref:serine hydrolase domain-containing protein n=1 Tax=Flavihumibacter rivuli TaxID=2838156 RepID=UPI001BDDD7F4|nr:serine hydrolase domain-containing protein [Flavihumibacter rivuli]ULQ54912.1 beta-lactamase family protein [Flavihumibacter rivuli]
MIIKPFQLILLSTAVATGLQATSLTALGNPNNHPNETIFTHHRPSDTTRLLLGPADADSLKARIASTNFSGTFQLVQGNQTIMSFSKGWASEQAKQTNTAETRYNIGSIGKSLTAILIMQLVEQQAIQLDQPVNKYLSKSWQIGNGDKITIRHCLNQTSGLGDYFEHPKYNDSATRTIDQHMALVKDMKLVKDTPGIDLHYSNSGFIVLGKILEERYQKSYQEIVKTKLLQPAGIDYAAKVPYGTGYAQKDGVWVIGEGNDPSHWTSAGGIFLNTRELNQVLTALLKGKYISAASLQQLWGKESRPAHEPPFVHYGLGWMVEDPGGFPLRGHNGGVRGFQAAFRYVPSDDISFYIFSNRDGGAEEVFMMVLFYMMEKKGVKM